MAATRRKTPARAAPPGWRALLGRIPFAKLALELVVVFIGVSAAFWLEEWRQDRQEARDARAVYRALAEEVGLTARDVGPRQDAEIRAQLADWRRRRAAGERPALIFRVTRGATRPPSGVWDAVVADGAVTLVGPHMTACLARFYNRLASVGDAFERYDAFALAEVMPYQNRPEAFYGPDGELKPQYASHLFQLERYQIRYARVIRDGQALMPILERGDAGARCPVRTNRPAA